MIPVLFKEDEQIFTHNGIGALYESLSCNVIEEENGAFTMELEYPVDGELFSEIKDFRVIQAKPNDIDDPHNFRIYEIEKSIDELTVYVRANTRTNDLGSNLITNYQGVDVTPQQAMNGIKSNLIEPTNFDFMSDIQTKSNVEWTRINPLNAIVGVRGSLVDIWGGQIKRTNTAIHLYSRRGRDNVVTIRPGKNIEGLKMTVSTAGLVTKILPTFTYRPVDVPEYQMVTLSDGTREKRRVQASGSTTLRDDITVIGNVVSSQYVNNYPTNYWSSVDYGDDDELKSKVDVYIDTRLTAAEESPTILNMSGFENDLKNFVKDELDKKAKQYFTHRNPGVDKPTVRIKVDMLQLSDSPDWEEFKDLERIGLTDTLDVWVKEYDIDVEVRVTSLTYDSIAEHVTNFNAGSDGAPRQSAIEKKYDDLTKATNDYITSFKNGVQNIMRNTADGLNRKFEGYTEPPAELSSEGDIWFKEIGEGKVEIWIHDGVYWQPLMTEDFGDKLLADIEATQAELEEAKQQAKLDSDQALADAKAHAEAEDARIRGELELEVGGAIELAEQAKQDAIDKANQALEDAIAHADAEDARIRGELESEIGGAMDLAEQAKADVENKANQAYEDAVIEADRLAAIRDNGITIEAGQITAGVIDAARLNAVNIVTSGLTANVIKSNHIETSTATIDKLFATDVMVDTLTAKTAFINSIKAVDIDASKISSGTINTERLNTSAIVTAGLSANVITSNHIATSTATVDKIFANQTMINQLTTKTAFINSIKAVEIDAGKITSGTINAARLNASAIVTAGLSANVVKATHISGDTALFDKLFSTSSATDRLSARSAWIKNANIANAEIDGAKIKDATIASAKIANIDASKISTGTLDGISITGGEVYLRNSSGNTNAGMSSSGTASTSTRIWAGGTYGNRASAPFRVQQSGKMIATDAEITGKITSDTGTIGIFDIKPGEIEARDYVENWHLRIGAPYGGIGGGKSPFWLGGGSPVSTRAMIYPDGAIQTFANLKSNSILPNNSSGNIGASATDNRFNRIYLQTQPNVSSDVRQKNSIQDIPEGLIEKLKDLEPKMFKQNDDEDGLWHFGYVAQDVERVLYQYALEEVGYEDAQEYVKDFAFLHKDESYLSLLYGEIAVLREKEMRDRIAKLELQIEELKGV